MPIAINGSGTITGISVGGLPDGVITTDDIAANAVTTAKLGTNEASGLAKAWVNFNGTGTVAIRASFNVSSITDNGTGDYTVNFTTALADANYSLVGTTAINVGANVAWSLNPRNDMTSPAPYTTTGCRFNVKAGDVIGPQDSPFVNVAIFR